MSSQRQIEANRRNAQKSTGPTSVTGKAASSMNALKTGIHAKSLLLPSEKLADLEHLIEEYYNHHNPTTPEARALVDDLIYGEWLKRRLRTAETQLWAHDHQERFTPDPKYPLGQTAASRGKAFAQLQWRMECTRRASRQALQDLQQLQAAAGTEPLNPTPQTTSPQNGFVLPFPSPGPLQPEQIPEQCDISHISPRPGGAETIAETQDQVYRQKVRFRVHTVTARQGRVPSLGRRALPKRDDPHGA